MITQECRDQEVNDAQPVGVSAASRHGHRSRDTLERAAVASVSGSDHCENGDHSLFVAAGPVASAGNDRARTDTQGQGVIAGGDHIPTDDQCSRVDAGIIVRLIAYGRIRRQLVSFDTRATLQVKAIERMEAQVGTVVSPSGRVPAPPLSAAMLPILAATAPVKAERRAVERQIVKLAKDLPVWPWVEAVRGVGALGLGLIVGEAEDLSRYANPGKLWKRLGMAVMDDGKAQRRIATTEGGLAAGYSPRRRSLMHVIGESLIKQNGATGYYKVLYNERKAYELARAPEMALIHAHRRAMRYMEKRFLLHLWQAWKRSAIARQQSNGGVPVASTFSD